jgi:predicted HD superfamily hydrolase involved in NAD metabolism
VERKVPSLLHGPVGAELARRTFNIMDAEILGAIAYHTTGHQGMSDLQKLIFVSDAIEPWRDYPGIDEIRKAAFAERNLNKATLLCVERTLLYLRAKNYIVDRRMVLLGKAMRRLLKEGKKGKNSPQKRKKPANSKAKSSRRSRA